MTDTSPSWRYGPNGEAQIFDDPADAPKGWADHPGKVTDDPLDHDNDGKKGGSAKGAESTASKGRAKRAAK